MFYIFAIIRHLNILAKKHMETKFCKINAEKCPFLTGIVKKLISLMLISDY